MNVVVEPGNHDKAGETVRRQSNARYGASGTIDNLDSKLAKALHQTRSTDANPKLTVDDNPLLTRGRAAATPGLRIAQASHSEAVQVQCYVGSGYGDARRAADGARHVANQLAVL